MLEINNELISLAKAEIVDQSKIVDQVWTKVNFSEIHVRKNFCETLLFLNSEALEVYLSFERRAIERLASEWIRTQSPEIRKKFMELHRIVEWESFLIEASRLFSEFGFYVQKLEKDLGNMRKARGGTTFQEYVLKMLNYISISAVRNNAKGLGRIDIIIPSIEVAMRQPDRAIFLTCKRTLRERWKQEVPSGRMNMRYYLITIDEKISEAKAREINEKGLIAFVPDTIKNNTLVDLPWIRALSDLPNELGAP